jgi:hypothetical protein
VRCAGAVLTALKSGRAGPGMDPDDPQHAVTVRIVSLYARAYLLVGANGARADVPMLAWPRETIVHLNSNAFRSVACVGWLPERLCSYGALPGRCKSFTTTSIQAPPAPAARRACPSMVRRRIHVMSPW